jgi:hypothetical protein
VLALLEPQHAPYITQHSCAKWWSAWCQPPVLAKVVWTVIHCWVHPQCRPCNRCWVVGLLTPACKAAAMPQGSAQHLRQVCAKRPTLWFSR